MTQALSTIPDEMADFLIQEKAESLFDFKKKGTELVETHKDVCADEVTELRLGAYPDVAYA